MWVLNNRTPYSAERNWTRDKQGMHLWLVAVKATFDIGASGKLVLCEEQPPPLLAPEYRGDPATSSLRLDSDLLSRKPATDFLIDASAHAPGGRAAATVPVAFRLGGIEKTLLVHGVRTYRKGVLGLAAGKPRPFVSHPIHYEWAFGGADVSHTDPARHRLDARNPVGKGFGPGSVDQDEEQLAHSIEYPDGDPSKRGPAGFGPIASYWSPRLERAGTYDAVWERTKKPLLPDDYDDQYALSSPDDQRLPRPLLGGEAVTLLNMTPSGVLRFELPRISLAFCSSVPTVMTGAGSYQVDFLEQPEGPARGRARDCVRMGTPSRSKAAGCSTPLLGFGRICAMSCRLFEE